MFNANPFDADLRIPEAVPRGERGLGLLLRLPELVRGAPLHRAPGERHQTVPDVSSS